MEPLKKEITLKEFIDGNNHLLSAMAVLAALFALIGKLPINWLNSILSFLFIGGIIIILFEINSGMPKEKERSLRLTLFQPVLLLGMWATIAYWLLLYRAFWNMFLWAPLWLLLVFSYHSTITEMIEVLKYISERRPAKSKLRVIVCLIKKILDSKIYRLSIILFALISAIYYSIPLNIILNLIQKINP